MLNYAYAVLESQVRIATLSQGLDPAIGYLHVCRLGRVALVYDLMEPLRPLVDRLVLHFARSRTFTPNDFVLTARGVCRLHPQLSREVVQFTASDSSMHSTLLWLIEILGCSGSDKKEQERSFAYGPGPADARNPCSSCGFVPARRRSSPPPTCAAEPGSPSTASTSASPPSGPPWPTPPVPRP